MTYLREQKKLDKGQKMKRKIGWDAKREMIMRECRYKYAYFCDGMPNRSIKGQEDARPISPCTKKCELRKTTVLGEDLEYGEINGEG